MPSDYPLNQTHRADSSAREPLAVVGIGCRLPGGIDSPTTYWNALLAGGGERPPLKLAAHNAIGVLAVSPEAGTSLWLNLQDVSAEGGVRVPISSADAWVILPAKPPRSHNEPALGIEDQAVRALLAAAGARSGEAARLEEDAFPFAFLPFPERVLDDVREDQVAAVFCEPHRPFRPAAPRRRCWRRRS